MDKIVTGTYTGTGAALSESIGFKPSMVKIYNYYGGLVGIWDSSMADAAATIMNPYIAGTGTILSDPVPQIGSTKTNVANVGFQYSIAGVPYTKAAVAAGTAPTATTVPQNKWGLFGFELASDGTIDKKDAAGNSAGYASEALAIAAKPSASSSHILAFYITVMSTAAGGFVGATTELDASVVTCNYYANSASYIASGGITPLGDTNDTYFGFQVGTSAYLNTAGAVYFYEAIR